RINAYAGSLLLSGAININGVFLLTVTGSGNTTFEGAVTGAGGLTKDGSGTLVLPVGNSYAGNTTLVYGTVIVSADAALGAANTDTTIDAGATLALSGGFNYSTSETLTSSGAGLNGAGALENLSGNNSWDGSIILAGSSTLKASAGNLTLSGPVNTGSF